MTCCDRIIKPNEFHCAACCQTFGIYGLFDAHQAVDRDGVFTGSCKAPGVLGAVRDIRGAWQTPEGLQARARARSIAIARNTARAATR